MKLKYKHKAMYNVTVDIVISASFVKITTRRKANEEINEKGLLRIRRLKATLSS